MNSLREIGLHKYSKEPQSTFVLGHSVFITVVNQDNQLLASRSHSCHSFWPVNYRVVVDPVIFFLYVVWSSGQIWLLFVMPGGSMHWVQMFFLVEGTWPTYWDMDHMLVHYYYALLYHLNVLPVSYMINSCIWEINCLIDWLMCHSRNMHDPTCDTVRIWSLKTRPYGIGSKIQGMWRKRSSICVTVLIVVAVGRTEFLNGCTYIRYIGWVLQIQPRLISRLNFVAISSVRKTTVMTLPECSKSLR